jgi:hypothetical protein
VCKHFIQTKLAYELRVKSEQPQWEEYLRAHPFTGGHGACHFKKKSMAQSKLSSTDDYESTSNTWKLVPKRTLLQHSINCPGVGKIKARQLIADPGFRNQVVANGRASLSELTRYVILLLV